MDPQSTNTTTDAGATSILQQATINQATGTLKLILAAGGMWFVNHGYLDQGSEAEIAGGIAAMVVAFVWMMISRRLNGMVKATAGLPGVGAVVMTSEAAAKAVPLSNVVGSATEASRLPGVAA